MATTSRSKATVKDTPRTELDTRVFGVVPTDHALLKEAYLAYMANGRENLATTKTRAEVRGGGKKPWRQKGTGRARIGSIRAPHWRGGGVVHGPTGAENYSKHLNVKAKRLALRQALSLAAQAGRVHVIDAFDRKDGKVSKTAEQFKKIGATGNILLALAHLDDMVVRATGNVPKLKAVHAAYLNVVDVMNADSIVLEKAALEAVVAWLAEDTKVAPSRKETK